ncbi:hypothetical protein BQ8482_110478 [Mesorhizobium delmotii]|uniref:Uncharacterized protein n=1 Tax=Mesorhizobium delmotii TaxID=1631247 RepID=A0A2P9ABN1_9HYPH|nr:hypothetical protein BQ8482_110478 [Mesorhizobium delmotii]
MPIPATCIFSTPTDIPSHSTWRKQRQPNYWIRQFGEGKNKSGGQGPPLLCIAFRSLLAAEQVPVAALRGGLLYVARGIEQLVNRRAGIAYRRRLRVVDVDGRLLVDVGSANVVVAGIGAAGSNQKCRSGENDLLHFSNPGFSYAISAAAAVFVKDNAAAAVGIDISCCRRGYGRCH